MNPIKTWLVALGMLVLAGATQAATTYICVGLCTGIVITNPNLPPPQQGKLVNILDVPVNGTLYDVAFVDGSFNDIFGAGAPSLTFTTQGGAEQAASALRDVLVDVGSGGPTVVQAFDSNPSLTRGCALDVACVVMTPFEVPAFLGGAAFRQVGFVNDNPFLGFEPGDSFVGLGTGLLEVAGLDYTAYIGTTFAVWRVAGGRGADDPLNRFFAPPAYGAASPSDVSEPAALLLVVVGAIGLAASRRKN